ncbi:hypothetical protein F2Q68_00003697 [Brassica cretica]|uniref:Uncharacterized protein n=1 Tax=Brassica cretica TaxID=69181 RepID=A0A8S9J7B3_BRACR|nr:hypothetical protein F2Q68_00003697 [Brassica cretica]
MKIDDNFIFVASEVSSFEIRPQIVDPPETAALAATEETGGSRERSPAAFAVGFDQGDLPMVPSASSSCSALVSEEVVVGLLWREEREEIEKVGGGRWA